MAVTSIVFLLFTSIVLDSTAFNLNINRRAFFYTSAGGFISTSIIPLPSHGEDLLTITKSIKVSPLAHTFIISKSDAKPVRENDATRILTNAKVVFMFYTDNNYETLSKEIFDLTLKRKIGEGAGVNPGRVCYASLGGNSKFIPTDDATVTFTKISKIDDISTKIQYEKGDVIFIEPLPSRGTLNDAKMLADTAKQLGVDVGSKKSGGVVSVLMNGPRAPNNSLKIIEDGFDAATLLWYDI